MSLNQDDVQDTEELFLEALHIAEDAVCSRQAQLTSKQALYEY